MRLPLGQLGSIVFDPPTLTDVRNAPRTRRGRLALALCAAGLTAGIWLLVASRTGVPLSPAPVRAVFQSATGRGAGGLLAARRALSAAAAGSRRYVPFGQAPAAADQTLAVTSSPDGARVELDGRARGHTPTALAVAAGEHRIRLRRDGYGDVTARVRVLPGQPAAFDAQLWPRTPSVQRLRPAYPGASIESASFLADGSVAVLLALPPGTERQVWIVAGPEEETGTPAGAPAGTAPDEKGAAVGDTGVTARRIGPDGLRAGLAVAPHTQRIAYLMEGQHPPAGGLLAAPASWSTLADSMARFTEVWIASPDGSGAARRYVVPPPIGGERLVDVAWAPDETHLLIASRVPLTTGGSRTRLRWVGVAPGPARDDGAPDGGDARDLVALPADVLPGSYRWNPAGDQVAFLARAAQTTSLCVLDVTDGRFRYVADVAQGTAPPLFTPAAWSPDGARLAYTAPVPDRPSHAPISWLTGSKTAVDLFTDGPGIGPHGAPARRRLGAASGGAAALGQWPGWRSDGSLVVLARPSGSGPLVVRSTHPGDGGDGGAARGAASETHDLAPLTALPASITGYAATWDVAHAQALLALRSTTGSGTGAAGRLDYWLVRFRRSAAPDAGSDQWDR
jgi:hypothetical protein